MATIHIFKNLDEAIPSVKQQLHHLPPNSAVRIKIQADGGSIRALFELWRLFQKAKKQKGFTYTVEALKIRSAALMLFICFPIEDRIITKMSKGSIHLPVATFNGSDVREKAIEFISENTALNNNQVIYYEFAPLDAKKMVSLGIAKQIQTPIPIV